MGRDSFSTEQRRTMEGLSLFAFSAEISRAAKNHKGVDIRVLLLQDDYFITTCAAYGKIYYASGRLDENTREITCHRGISKDIADRIGKTEMERIKREIDNSLDSVKMNIPTRLDSFWGRELVKIRKENTDIHNKSKTTAPKLHIGESQRTDTRTPGGPQP